MSIPADDSFITSAKGAAWDVIPPSTASVAPVMKRAASDARNATGQGVVLEDYDGPVVPGINMCYLPMDAMTIVDSWFVSGMQGTGSDTAIAENVYIPDSQMVLMNERAGQIDPTKRHFGAPSDLLPAVPVVRTTGIAQLIGAVEAMVEIVTAESTQEAGADHFHPLAHPVGCLYARLGEAAAMIDTAKLILWNLTAKLDRVALGEDFTLAEKAQHRAAGAQMIELVHGASESLMVQVGSSAFALDKPINRYWRDVSMATRHIQNIPTIGYEIYGRDMTGADGISPPGAY